MRGSIRSLRTGGRKTDAESDLQPSAQRLSVGPQVGGRARGAVSIAAAEKTITLTITDSGPGVAEHIRNSLFEPFVSDGKHSGTGLGLTLANSVAKEHGGAVTLLSTQPGETIFRLSLCTDFTGLVTNTTQEQPETSSPTPGGILQ